MAHGPVDEIPFECGGPSQGVRIPGQYVDSGDTAFNALDAAEVSRQRMQQVIDTLEDPENTDLSGALRLLAIEIATSLGGDFYSSLRVMGAPGVRVCNDRIKNLRELSKQIQDAESMSNRDFLNFDGLRFQYVFREIMLLFRSSAIKGGLEPEVADHMLRVFRGEFMQREQDLRRETAKLDPSTMNSTISNERPAPCVPELPSSEESHA